MKRWPSLRTLERWLRRAGLTVPPPPRARPGPQCDRPALTAATAPNDVWTVDFKGWFRTADGQRCEALTVRDLATRYVLAVQLVAEPSDRCVRAIMQRLFVRYGRPRVIRVDNGAPFAGKGALNLTTLSVWWLACGVQVEFTRPGKPQDNGAHEQMHRVLKAETATPPAPTRRAQQARFETWRQGYNQRRPHAGIQHRCPAELYRVSPRRWPPPAAKPYPKTWLTRRVRNRFGIKLQGRVRFIGRAFVRQNVGLQKLEPGVHAVYFRTLQIGTLHQSDAEGMRPCAYRQLHPRRSETSAASQPNTEKCKGCRGGKV